MRQERRALTLVDLLTVRNRERLAFTIIELLVLLALAALVIIAGCNVFSSSGGAADKAACVSNLRAIGGALAQYAALNGGKFPRVHSTGDPLAAPTAANSLRSISTNAMNQVWGLIDQRLLEATAFKCPADEKWKARTASEKYGWADASEFSYGIQYPFDRNPTGEAANPACPNSAAYGSAWIVMADRNPGKRVASNKDWANHPEGCAYLGKGGNVAFHEDSSSVISSQEIYGDDDAADGDIFPDSAGDIVILPDAPAD